MLALDDFAAILEKHEVAEVVHLSAYRPPPKNWPAAKMGARHGGALALDAAIFLRKDGTKLDVSKIFTAQSARRPAVRRAGRGRRPNKPKHCARSHEAADAHLFNVELTPDFNKKHKNDFHLEVTPGVKWFMVK